MDPEIFTSLAPTDRELTDDELMALSWQWYTLAASMRIREFAWLQYRDGLLDESAWEGYATVLVNTLSSKPGRLAWKTYKPELDPGFVAYIDARLPED